MNDPLIAFKININVVFLGIFCIEMLLLDFTTDNNKCINNNGECECSCHNTIRSYYYSCNNSGYIINSDNHHCDDKIIDTITSYIV